MLSSEESQKVRQALALIQQAQSLILQAQQELCPLEDFGDLWTSTGKLHDAVKKFWHRVNNRAVSLRSNAKRPEKPLFVP